jgi:hypothetical protein
VHRHADTRRRHGHAALIDAGGRGD